LRECATAEDFRDPSRLGLRIKALPLKLARPRPIDEAISTAGGVRFEALSPGLMLQGAPGVFCAGEMLDWEAPTGGYLLTACMASGVVAASGVMDFLAAQELEG
jgi:predicted flavoprotein YhiN